MLPAALEQQFNAFYGSVYAESFFILAWPGRASYPRVPFARPSASPWP
jgi:hypothetical protein